MPYRKNPGGLEVLLITSRGTGRWVIPKGGVKKGFTPAEAAEREAYEEAGIKGALSPDPLGCFSYNKRLRNGASRPASVEVYAMRVVVELKKWPERAQRRLKWMSIPHAVKLVDEEGMKVLLLRLEQIEGAAFWILGGGLTLL